MKGKESDPSDNQRRISTSRHPSISRRSSISQQAKKRRFSTVRQASLTLALATNPENGNSVKFNGFVGRPEAQVPPLTDQRRPLEEAQGGGNDGLQFDGFDDNLGSKTANNRAGHVGSLNRSKFYVDTPVQRTDGGLVVSRDSVYVEKTQTSARTFAVTDTVWGTKFAVQRRRDRTALPPNWSPQVANRTDLREAHQAELQVSNQFENPVANRAERNGYEEVHNPDKRSSLSVQVRNQAEHGRDSRSGRGGGGAGVAEVDGRDETREYAYVEKTATSVRAFAVNDGRHGATQISPPQRYTLAEIL